VLAKDLQILILLQQDLHHFEELDALLNRRLLDQIKANLQELDPIGVQDGLSEAFGHIDFFIDAQTAVQLVAGDLY